VPTDDEKRRSQQSTWVFITIVNKKERRSANSNPWIIQNMDTDDKKRRIQQSTWMFIIIIDEKECRGLIIIIMPTAIWSKWSGGICKKRRRDVSFFEVSRYTEFAKWKKKLWSEANGRPEQVDQLFHFIKKKSDFFSSDQPIREQLCAGRHDRTSSQTLTLEVQVWSTHMKYNHF
jgi:hypothetical protein